MRTYPFCMQTHDSHYFIMNSVVNYRLCGKPSIGRKKRKSAVRAAAYISREKLFDEEANEFFDFRYGRSKALYKQMLGPDNMPIWATDRQKFWNAVQKKERRADSQFARMWEVSLPYELKLEEMIMVLKMFIRNNFTCHGIVVDVALHAPDKDGNDKNYHAHFLQSLRAVGPYGFIGNKLREWKDKKLLKQRRKSLALECSRMLQIAGYLNEAKRWRYGHLTLIEQYQKAFQRADFSYVSACNHEPTKHKGFLLHRIEIRERLKRVKNYAQNNAQFNYENHYQNDEHLSQATNFIKKVDENLRQLQTKTQNVNQNDYVITEDFYTKYSDILPINLKVGSSINQEFFDYITKRKKRMSDKNTSSFKM